jgi:hypothetical protein
MSIGIRNLVMVGLLAAAAAPMSAQSANRTTPNISVKPAKVGTLATEPDARRRCRVHCQSQAGAAWHVNGQHPSVAERDARQTLCAKRMS